MRGRAYCLRTLTRGGFRRCRLSCAVPAGCAHANGEDAPAAYAVLMTIFDSLDYIDCVSHDNKAEHARFLATIARLSKLHYSVACDAVARKLHLGRRAGTPLDRTLTRLVFEFNAPICVHHRRHFFLTAFTFGWAKAMRLPILMFGHEFQDEARDRFRSRKKKILVAEQKRFAKTLDFLVADVPLRNSPAREIWQFAQRQNARGISLDDGQRRHLEKMLAKSRDPKFILEHMRRGHNNESAILRATDDAFLYAYQSYRDALNLEVPYDEMPLMERLFSHTASFEQWEAMVKQLPSGSEVMALLSPGIDSLPEKWDRYSGMNDRIRSHVWAIRVPQSGVGL